MPTLTIPRNYSDSSVLTEAQLDAAFDSVETLLNTTLLDSSNLATGAVDSDELASNSVTAAKIATSVAGDGLTGGGGSALAVNVDGSTIEISSDTVQVKDGGVSTAKIASGAVTQAKRAALGQQISSSSSIFSSTSTSKTDVTNLTVTITTTGRAVRLELVGDGSGNPSYVATANASGVDTASSSLSFIRGSTNISEQRFGGQPVGGNTSGRIFYYPPSMFQHVDVPAAGTYTYKIQSDSDIGSSGGTITTYVYYCKLVAYEL